MSGIRRDYDKWLCPFCDRRATLDTEQQVLCVSRTCSCGAIALAAPTVDMDEIVDDALGIFAVQIREESRGYDTLMLKDLRRAGVEIREGERVLVGEGFWGEYASLWFRRSQPPASEDADRSRDDTVEFPVLERKHPESIGGYTIVHCLARGNFTDIYEAVSPKSPDRRYVLKVLRKDSNGSNEWFASVASLTNSLDHPNILPCDPVISAEASCFIVMPYVNGSNLLDTVKNDGVLAPVRLLQLVDSTARALDYAHERGVIHGNLHPKHILLDRDDNVWVIGFAEVTSKRPSHLPFGNPHHLAPEQIVSNSTILASDVYALAEVSYLCLCGSFPFGGQRSASAMLQRKQSGPIPSIRESRPELSKRLDEVLQRGMAIHADERYSSAGKFAKSLSAALESTTKPR